MIAENDDVIKKNKSFVCNSREEQIRVFCCNCPILMSITSQASIPEMISIFYIYYGCRSDILMS